MSEATRLLRADLDEAERALVVEWGDGHASRYPLAYLRQRCPCATCRAERDAASPSPFRIVGPAASAELVGVEPVGRYGMRLVWADGHQAGIYTFEALRGLCPCAACRASRAGGSGDEPPFVHGIAIPK